MTPKEKAQELFNNFLPYVEAMSSRQQEDNAKECALIAVDEMICEYQLMSDTESVLVINNEVVFVVNQLIYWREVKTEIKKL
jgi:hypothetical protein